MKPKMILITTLFTFFCVVAKAQTITKVAGSYCVNSETVFILAGSSCTSYSWSVSGGTNGVDYTVIGSWNQSGFRVKWLKACTASVGCSYVCNNQSGSTIMWPSFTIGSPVNPTVSIVATPGSAVCQGSNVTFAATSTNGGSAPSYNWKINGATVSTGSSPTWVRSNLVNGDVVSAVLTSNATCASVLTATSNSITMSINAAVPVSATLISPSAICSATSTNASFSVNVTNGGGSPIYTWYKNGNIVSDRMSGPPLWVYVPTTPLTNGDKIKCKVTSNAVCISGNPVTTSEYTVSLTPSVTPTVSIQVPKLNYCSGETISFTASSSFFSGGTTYTWRLNGNQFATTSSASLPVTSDINAVGSFRPGAVVTLDVTGLAGPCLSGSITNASTSTIPLVIYPSPAITISPAGTLKIPSTATQTITATAGYSYQWKKDAVSISPGGTGNRYVASSAGIYTVVASANGCSKESVSLTLSKNSAPVANAGIDQSIAMQVTPPDIVLKGSGTDADGNVTSFSWRLISGPNVPMLSNPGSATLTVSNVVTGNYVFGLKVTDNFGEESAEDAVKVSMVYPPNNFNWVRETEVLIKNKLTEADVSALKISNGEKNVTWKYIDGTGRTIQTIKQQSSPSGKDIIVPEVYDGYGREWRMYLPTKVGQTSGYHILNNDIIDNTTGNYKGVAGDTYLVGSDNGIPDDVRPFSETTYEPSPINRSRKEFGAGKDWFNNDKAVTYKFVTNVHGLNENNTEEKVILWKLTNRMPERNTSVNSGFYPSASLSIKVTNDENGNEAREYVNCIGQTILKKIQARANPTSLNAIDQWALTYFVYDDFGNLAFVFQPELSKALHSNNTYNPSATDLHNYAFQYTYDQRHRMVVKKIPGADSVFLIYDSRNRVILTQDGNQRSGSRKEWTFTKYDALNRPLITGLYTHATAANRKQMISAISNLNFEEVYNGTSSTHGYSNTAFPTSNTIVLTVTYYDNYKFKTDIAGASYDYISNDLTSQDVANTYVKGMVTGTRTNILGSLGYLWSVKYYDAKYRVLQTKNQNHKNQIDRATNLYDFSRLIETRSSHTNITTYSAHRKYEYDHMGRIRKLWHKFHNEPSFVLLYEHVYNELGDLILKKLHSRDGGSTYSQNTDYKFGIRGELETINDPYSPESGDLFCMELKYHEPSSHGGAPMFNGNVSETIWVNAGDDRQSFGYKYDAMNRITEANYFNHNKPVADGRFSEKILSGTSSYDLNGNIRNLVRYGRRGTNQFGVTDNLNYQFYTGNQVTTINDSENEFGFDDGFKDAVEDVNEYTYDANGNLTKDLNKQITSITYNFLNLPVQVTASPTNYVVFTYDASGRKLTQKVYGTGAKTCEYFGEYYYENTGGTDVLKFVGHDEGRIVPDNTPGTSLPWEYQYFLRDHIDNVRVVFSEKKITKEFNATFENAAQEQGNFKNYPVAPNTFIVGNHTPGGTKSHLLNGGYNAQVGLAKSLAVKMGDVLDFEVFARYESPGGSGTATNFETLLINAFGISSGGTTALDGPAALSAFQNTFAAAAYIGGNGPAYENAAAPRAYLNYILFDQSYSLIDFGFDQIDAAATSFHDLLSLHLKVPQDGYLYVYYSNEQPTQTNVYFDDLKIIHHAGAIEQINNYYPFGLTFNSYYRENSVKNRNKFNGGSEFVDDLGLKIYLTDVRDYDPARVGWWQIDPKTGGQESWSPYHFSFNNPVRYNDPQGDCPPAPCVGLENLAIADAVAHPNGIGAHTLGIAQGLQNSVEGLVNAVAHPVRTMQGIGNLALAGVAGNPVSAMQMDMTLGTNSYGAMMGVTNSITNGANNLINGDGIERGTVIGEIGGMIAGGKGLGQAIKLSGEALSVGLRSVTTPDGFLFGSLSIKTPFDIPVQRFGTMSIGGESAFGLRTGSSPFMARAFNAILPKWNNLTNYTIGIIPKGTAIRIGITAPQSFRYLGGLPQLNVKPRLVVNQSTNLVN